MTKGAGRERYLLERIPTHPPDQCGSTEAIERFLFVIAGQCQSKLMKPWITVHVTNLISCGIGSVLSIPNAINPTMEI